MTLNAGVAVPSGVSARWDDGHVWAWLGPTLLFVGAMITLWVTNFRADKREWNKWRRDTLVKLCADAITESQEAVAMCESALSQARHVSAQANLTSASKAAARIGTIAEQLYLINANYLADACASMRTAADAINSPASQLRTANINAAHAACTAEAQGRPDSEIAAEFVASSPLMDLKKATIFVYTAHEVYCP